MVCGYRVTNRSPNAKSRKNSTIFKFKMNLENDKPHQKLTALTRTLSSKIALWGDFLEIPFWLRVSNKFLENCGPWAATKMIQNIKFCKFNTGADGLIKVDV